jgi:hypothetical protein
MIPVAHFPATKAVVNQNACMNLLITPSSLNISTDNTTLKALHHNKTHKNWTTKSADATRTKDFRRRDLDRISNAAQASARKKVFLSCDEDALVPLPPLDDDRLPSPLPRNEGKALPVFLALQKSLMTSASGNNATCFAPGSHSQIIKTNNGLINTLRFEESIKVLVMTTYRESSPSPPPREEYRNLVRAMENSMPTMDENNIVG